MHGGARLAGAYGAVSKELRSKSFAPSSILEDLERTNHREVKGSLFKLQSRAGPSQ